MVGISVLQSLAALSLFGFTLAHPGERHDEKLVAREMEIRSAMAESQARELNECEGSFDVVSRRDRAIARRAETVRRLREERGLETEPLIHRRTVAQFNTWSQVKHDHTGESQYNTSASVETLFGANTSCIFAPDNANGPYFVQGEQIRTNLVEDQPGVPVHWELQFVDTTTCKPATNLLIDVWSCNAKGIYSGVSAAGQGGLQTTFLRGVQNTDSDGVVNFDAIFPGHYQGRATHEHIITHSGATILPNGSYSGGHISHLSQLFFDQALIDAVEKLSPYNTNTIPRTSNAADLFTGYSATAAYDPFPEYVMLGSSLSQGLFMWAELGINPSQDVTRYAPHAAYVAADGGHNNPAMDMSIVGTPPPSHG